VVGVDVVGSRSMCGGDSVSQMAGGAFSFEYLRRY